ncbi:MAG: hypothetical protein QGH45_22925, partial [Myxococcota bacterium]|nr:hypothetical protein [Myxococcota bacterium]
GEGQTVAGLGLDGSETFGIDVDDDLQPGQAVEVEYTADGGRRGRFSVTCRIDTPIEVDYYRNGGILHTVLRALAR